jgi:hypothetical protein
MLESFKPSGSTGDCGDRLMLNMCRQLRLLNGDGIVPVTKNTAKIETKLDARQTYRRKPSEPGRGLPWEMAQ